ncbi:Galectin carbohydrate recognition domain [Schistosoma japonicum]|nr:Galectin carbohydrate recognition domain [Schistosoma japonicum]
MHESFDDQDTEFTYEIPDCLMDGDYIELHGVCHGERIVFELLTKEGSTQNLVDELPLQIILTTNGPVTVISRNRKEVAKQERFVKNGIQDNQSFELCVHACEDRYIVILNKEKVCEQRHLVPLRDAFALSMQGKVDILSLEFKDIYYDEEEMNNTANMSSANNNTGSFRADDMHTGFVRVNELRQSSIRRSEPPIMVPTRTGSKMEKQSIKSKDSNLEVTAWKTSNDLSRADLDIDYKLSPLDRNSAVYSYRNSNDFSHSSESRMFSTLPPVGKSVTDAMGSRGNLNTNGTSHLKSKPTFAGFRKSATLSTSKIDQNFNLEGRSQTDVGDILHGSYHVLDDEEHMMSQLTATTSTPNLQDKHKKKRFSLLGKSRQSTGSETDVRKDSKKNKGSMPDIKSKDAEGEKKKKGLHFKNPFKRSKSKDKTTPATSSGSLNRSEPGFAKQVSVPGINLGVSNRLSKEISKKPAPEIAAYLQKTNPAIEYEAVNLTGLKHLSDDVHFTPFDRKYSDEYENISGHHDQYKQKTLSNPRQSVNISPTSDLHSQGKFKGPAPEVASIIHSKHPASNLGDITITQGPDSHFRPFTPDQSPKTLRRTSELSTDLANLKLKGTAPEMAAVIHSRSKSPNREDITLTQGNDLHFNLNSTVDVEGSKHFKKSGSASEIAADIHKNNLAGRFPYDDYTLTGFSESPTQRIKYDVKGNLKTSRKAISLSERISGDEDTESGGSEVFTDNECYLEVGRSQYYFERKRSLKNYRSKRSKKLEREARRNMGLSRNDSEESPSSSISSLKPTDRKLTPKYRKRSGNRKEEVSSWLKSANSSNSPVRIESNVRSSYTSNVYAAAPLIQQPSIQKYMLKDINELIKGDATMDLPQPLTPGRSVLICGHFKCNKIINQSCLIQLQFITSCNQVSKCKILYLRIWSDGSLDVLNNLGTDAMISVSSPKNSQLSTINDNELCINDSQKIYFTIKFISQSFYTAITSNDLFTLLLKNQFPKSVSYQLTSFKLENSENAKLDKFIMPRNLCLPLIIRLQDASKVDNTLSLLTKLTADTKRVTIEYIYLPINSISVQIILDFVTNYLIIKKTSKYENDCIECAENELTYIPEQIREIKLHWYNNSLKVLLNTEESIIHNFGRHPSLHYLSHVQINGDFMLLNVELQSEEHNLPPKGYS